MLGAAASTSIRLDPDAVGHPAPHRAAVGRGALWFGVFGAPFFWSAQLIVTYVVAAHTCYPQRHPLIMSRSPAAKTTVCTVIVVALIGALVTLGVSAANWRVTRTEKDGAAAALLDAGEGRTRFMACAGILLSILFIGGVALSGLAFMLVPVCW